MSLKRKFGQNLIKLRMKHALTQEELAERVNCSLETISHIERGINGTRFSTLELLAEVFECEVYELFIFE